MIGLFACLMVSITNAQDANSSSTSQPASLKAYDNYDFVPGEKSFSPMISGDDRKGEFPAHWHLDYGQGVVTDFDGKKVFALYGGGKETMRVVMEPV
jgi:hypothetical protein